jgi:uncharacterized protein YqgV (UPF0045/DUF77 family)
VKLPTKSLGDGIITKTEVMPGVFLAESLTKAINGKFITGIVNTMEQDVILDPPQVLLEAVEDNDVMTLIHTAVPVEVTGRSSRICKQLRTDHLNDEQRVSLFKICDEDNDIFHLPGDALTCRTAAEHVIPTPIIDSSRAINTKPYTITETHNEEVKKRKLNRC